ncbi:MAG: hypothetical protein WAL22_09180 [Solirubrobacteraceae bacterium]
MGFGSRALLAAVLGFAAAFVVACGSSTNGLLASGQSSSIASQLTAISQAVQAGHCGQATAASNKLTTLVADLPAGVNQKLVANLGQGASTVQELAAKDCTTRSTTTPTVTAPTTSTQTSTATQTQTQTTSTTTTTQQTNTTPPPTTATNGGGAGTSSNTTAGGGAPVGGATKTSGG